MNRPREVELYDAATNLFRHYDEAEAKASYDFLEVKQLVVAARAVMKERYDVAVAAEWCPNNCGRLDWKDGALACGACGLTTKGARC